MTSSRLDTPGLNPEEPIPNAPFYSPETDYLQGAYSPITVGGGLEIDAATGSLVLDDYPPVIPFNLTLHCSPTGSDLNGDGSLENPWYSPQAAMDFLSSRIVPVGVTVTILVADGVYNFSSPIHLNHPNGERIQIVGETFTSTFTQETLNAAGPGYDGPVAAHVLTELQAAYGAQFYFTGCSGFLSTTGGGTVIRKLLIVGDNSSVGTFGIAVGSVFPLNVISTSNPYTKAILGSSTIRVGNCGITNWKGGGVLANGGGINLLPTSESGDLTAVTIAGNDDNGQGGSGYGGAVVACNGGQVFGDVWTIQNNTIAHRAFNNGFVGLSGTQQPYNFNVAVASENGTINIKGGNARGTINSFALIRDGGWISIENNNAATTTQAGFVGEVIGSGYIQARNGLGWLNPVFSPAADTIGNGIGYINTL